MANFVITTTSTSAQTLVSGETGYIATDGELVGSVVSPITGSGNVEIAVLGNVTSFGNHEAIDFDGDGFDMVIGAA
ncbi:MAG: hypothetical protein ACI91Z_000008 [Yoonia sp.]|jgi:hypothetical protein